IISKMGEELYGIYILCISLIGLMSFMDLGFGQGLLRFIPYYHARENYDKVNLILGVSLSVSLFLGILGASILYFFSGNIVDLLRIGSTYKEDAIISFRIVSFGFLILMLNSVVANIPKALQRYDLAVIIQNIVFFCKQLPQLFYLHSVLRFMLL
ncbi:MAG: MATE family efflux transporter, partial [Candidatus Calescibacterium sp.]|nr:MATE family efflux transporter [Candidatus Calescibacterium sp.]